MAAHISRLFRSGPWGLNGSTELRFPLFDIVRDRKRNAGGVTACGHVVIHVHTITTDAFLERILYQFRALP
jgi:hypothetical protein